MQMCYARVCVCSPPTGVTAQPNNDMFTTGGSAARFSAGPWPSSGSWPVSSSPPRCTVSLPPRCSEDSPRGRPISGKYYWELCSVWLVEEGAERTPKLLQAATELRACDIPDSCSYALHSGLTTSQVRACKGGASGAGDPQPASPTICLVRQVLLHTCVLNALLPSPWRVRI